MFSRLIEKPVLIILLFCLLMDLAVLNANEQDSLKEQVVRLHLIAHSNSVLDQEIKLALKNEVLKMIDLAEMSNANQTWGYLEGNLAEINNFCQNYILSQSFDYQVNSSLKIENFPLKEYGGQVFAAGEYKALKIVLGDGLGDNWWCVLYPPLCHQLYFEERKDNVRRVSARVFKEVKSKENSEILRLFLLILAKTWLF